MKINFDDVSGEFIWKWKFHNVDIEQLSIDDEKFSNNIYYKAEEIFSYLGLPDRETHTFRNGMYSAQYNGCLRTAIERNFIEIVWDEDFGDYDDDENLDSRLINFIIDIKKENLIADENKFTELLYLHGFKEELFAKKRY